MKKGNLNPLLRIKGARNCEETSKFRWSNCGGEAMSFRHENMRQKGGEENT